MTEPETSAPTLDVVIYGIINAGKSSLINALAGQNQPTSPIGGTTTQATSVDWRVVAAAEELPVPVHSAQGGEPSAAGSEAVGQTVVAPAAVPSDNTHFSIRLIDTPGLEEVDDVEHSRVATRAAEAADLVLFVLAEDLTETARRALVALAELGKPMVVAVNKVDLLELTEQDEILSAIRRGLDGLIPADHIVPIAAAPIVRRLRFSADGSSKVETTRGEPQVGNLSAILVELLATSGHDLKALASLAGQVEKQVASMQLDRSQRRLEAQRVADEMSAALAIALAVNPLPLLDFLTGPSGLAILVNRVATVYGESMSSEMTRGLALELIKGGRVALWGSLAATVGGGALKILPGFGHLAGAITQGVAAGYFGHVVGRALVDYLENGHDWGEGGLVAALDRIAASTDRKALTRGLTERIKARLRGARTP